MDAETVAPRRRTPWTLALTLLLAAVLLFFAVRGADWGAMWRTIQSGRPEYLGLAGVILCLTYLLRGVRWRILLGKGGPVPLRTVFWANMLGYLGNNVLPARAGELIRTAMIGRRTPVSMSFALATALTERIMDVFALIFIVFLSLFVLGTLQEAPDGLMAGARLLLAVMLVILVGLVVAPRLEHRALWLAGHLPGPARLRSRVQELVRQALLGLRAFQHPARAAGFWALTLIIWPLDAYWAVQVANAFAIPLTLSQALVLLAALGLSSAAPSTPGYVGIYQAVAVAVLGPFGIGQNEALVFILAYQAVNYFVVVVLGLLALWQLNRRARVVAAKRARSPG